MKKKIFNFLLQIIPVMIVVLLAFMVSNWSEQRNQKRKATVLLKLIKKEISVNHSKLNKIFPYHKMLMDSSNYYSKNIQKININKVPNFFRGLRTPNLSKSVFLSGNQTGVISEFNLELIQILNELYTTQENFNTYNHFSLEGLINLNYNENTRGYERVLVYISTVTTDMFYMEQELLDFYKKAEITLDNL